jgi:hypothetical protein
MPPWACRGDTAQGSAGGVPFPGEPAELQRHQPRHLQPGHARQLCQRHGHHDGPAHSGRETTKLPGSASLLATRERSRGGSAKHCGVKMMEAMLLIMSGLFMIAGLGVVIYRTLQR